MHSSCSSVWQWTPVLVNQLSHLAVTTLPSTRGALCQDCYGHCRACHTGAPIQPGKKMRKQRENSRLFIQLTSLFHAWIKWTFFIFCCFATSNPINHLIGTKRIVISYLTVFFTQFRLEQCLCCCSATCAVQVMMGLAASCMEHMYLAMDDRKIQALELGSDPSIT